MGEKSIKHQNVSCSFSTLHEVIHYDKVKHKHTYVHKQIRTHINTQTGRLTDRQADRQTDRQTDSQTDRQTHRHTKWLLEHLTEPKSLLVVTELAVEPIGQPVVIVIRHGGVQEVGDKLGEAGSPEALACQVGRVGQRKNVCCIDFEKPSGQLNFVPEGWHNAQVSQMGGRQLQSSLWNCQTNVWETHFYGSEQMICCVQKVLLWHRHVAHLKKYSAPWGRCILVNSTIEQRVLFKEHEEINYLIN